MGKRNDFFRDLRWLLNMWRARRVRDNLGFSARVKFDNELRPRLGIQSITEPEQVIAYPDALYYVEWKDVRRAILCSARI